MQSCYTYKNDEFLFHIFILILVLDMYNMYSDLYHTKQFIL